MNYVTVGDYIPVFNIVYLTYPNLLTSLSRIFGSGGQTLSLNMVCTVSICQTGVTFPVRHGCRIKKGRVVFQKVSER